MKENEVMNCDEIRVDCHPGQRSVSLRKDFDKCKEELF